MSQSIPPSQNDSCMAHGASADTRPHWSTFAQDELVTVIVGGEKTPFYIHRGILCAASPYVKTLLSLEWNLNNAASVNLTSRSVRDIQIATYWMYTKTVPELQGLEQCENDGRCSCFERYVSAYKAADQLIITSLQNALVDRILDHHRDTESHFQFDELQYILDEALLHTPLYQLVLDGAARQFCRYYQDERGSLSVLEAFYDCPKILKDIISACGLYDDEAWAEAEYIGNRDVYYIHRVEPKHQK